ncbi:uncharacterized protein LTR77_001693 [Saxophila tyrrhenica]|uniref:Life-span regulatory factor-domain-containing protein n=1 Tax=Saxophila tyrrhenica TaxID=1690608 RepID=A0AAV9PQK9_9PEZI|nr:hypothetical protein LTR77_001693 [Saxophila tyrrhenica]
MDRKHHARSGSQGRKLQPGHNKPSRPGQLQKRAPSYNNAQPHGHGAGSSSRPALGASKKAGVEIVSQDDDETGMASFLQFCATCEKQIITPGSSILYCSAACRKNDVSRTDHGVQSPSVVPTASSYFETAPADIIPQRSPTVPRPLSLASDISDYGSHHGDNQDSEALRYLSQFHSHDYSLDLPSRPRPRLNRASTATDSSGMPSLSHTPSSSVGTAASASSYSYRPLPPRRDPLTGHQPTKSADLVIPTYPTTSSSTPDQASLESSVSTLTAFRSGDGNGDDFAKRERRKRQSEPSGSLKKLFSHEAMQAGPSRD